MTTCRRQWHWCDSKPLTFSSSFFSIVTGSVAAQAKGKKKGGSRGKSGRLTEAEEDEQMLKSAQSKRRVIRLDTQPSILAPHCKMHSYQLEGLNWLIKLHCNGINGILADEVSRFDCCLVLWSICFYLAKSFLTPMSL